MYLHKLIEFLELIKNDPFLKITIEEGKIIIEGF